MPSEQEGFSDPSAPVLGLAGEPGLDREPWVQEVLTGLGANIRAARTAAGMTQEALAEVLGCTQTAVSYWEAGKRDPGVQDLLRIAEALSVPAASLLPDTAPKAAQGAAEGRLARVEVKGFRDLGIVRVSESTLAGEPMLRAESTDGAVAEFPASSLHFITWLPDGAKVPAAITSGGPWSHGGDDDLEPDADEADDYNEGGPF
jgi:transcriptional regulator with XRE-family HTH domain